MRYVISDIHGELDKLVSLIEYIDKDASQYIFLGDFVDKGNQSKGVLRFLTKLSYQKSCIFLMGNHEYAWLKLYQGEERFFDFLLKYGGLATVRSYLSKLDEIKELFLFCRELQYYYEIDEKFLCVHAGINPENKELPLDLHNKEELVFIRDKFIKSNFLYKGRRIIFAHTKNSTPYIDDYKIGIDTEGTLTAFNVDREEFVNHEGKQWKY